MKLTFSQMLAATPAADVWQWVLRYWGSPHSFQSMVNGWMYEAAIRFRKAEINHILENLMATKNPKQAAAQEKATWGGYKQVDLTDAQLKRLDKDVESGNVNVLDTLDRLLNVGKVTLNQKDGSVSATLTVEYQGQLWSLSAFSDLSWEAVLLLGEKHSTKNDWYADTSAPVKRRRG